MAGLLFAIGAFAFVAGLVMIGFGVPINEFSFGNTLISAGTTASVGGLIIIALGIAVRQLRRIAEMLAEPSHARLSLPAEEIEAIAGARMAPPASAPPQGVPGRVPYPPRPRAEPFGVESGPAPAPLAGAPVEEQPGQSLAPMLRNPDEGSLTVEDEVSLSPQHPQAVPAARAALPGTRESGAEGMADWRSPPAPSVPRPQPANFDAMWPVEAKTGKAPAKGARTEPGMGLGTGPGTGPGMAAGLGADLGAAGPAASAPKSEPAKRDEPEKPRAVAILKSGVVDGMGYTLYVDGSIEAELPQGTLRFASINELRSHLEKNS